MALSVDARNSMLDHLGTLATLASLHSADPGANGANEVIGGAYTREAITWNPAAAGNLDNNANPVFDVPAGTTVTHFGLWTAGGIWLGGGALSAAETFAGAGTYTLDDCDVDLN